MQIYYTFVCILYRMPVWMNRLSNIWLIRYNKDGKNSSSNVFWTVFGIASSVYVIGDANYCVRSFTLSCHLVLVIHCFTWTLLIFYRCFFIFASNVSYYSCNCSLGDGSPLSCIHYYHSVHRCPFGSVELLA